MRASVVLPTPRGPQKRYACPTRSSDTARRSVSETCSWAATSAKRRGRYFLANAVWDNALWFPAGWCGCPARRHLWRAVGRDAARKAKKCPRRPAATITALTAATGKVLTEFVGFRPTDLGHLKVRPRRKERQCCGNHAKRGYDVGVATDPRTSESLGPGALDMLQFNGSTGQQPYRNGVEPIGSRPEVAPRDPSVGGNGDRMALSPGDGLQRMAERGPATTFYLYKRDESILLHYEVDLLAEKTNITIEDPPTPLPQEGLGQRFEMTTATYGVHRLAWPERAGEAMVLPPARPAAEPHARSRPRSPGSAA